jgi:hypothetical protein
MVVPKVSHRNWWITKGNAQIALGTKEVPAEQLSFERCIGMITPSEKDSEMADPTGTPASYRQRMEMHGTYSHADWEDGVTIEIEAGDRDRPHRPELEQLEMEEWEERVSQEWPKVPVQELPFDAQLGLLLKRRHELLRWLHPRRMEKVADTSTGFEIINTSTGLKAIHGEAEPKTG